MRRRETTGKATSFIAFGLALAACGAPAGGAVGQDNTTADSRFVCNGMDAREVLGQIAGVGADLRRPREAVFYFYGPEARLAGFQRDLEALGFSVRPTRTDPGRIATVRRVVDEAWLAEAMPRVCEAARRHGVEYDGWEVAADQPAALPGQAG